MIEAAVNSFRIPDLRQKLLFTGAMLIIFRFIANIPVPGVNVDALRSLFDNNQLIGMLDLFSGGALSSFSVAAMGVYPYITAQIIVQLMIPVVPRLQEVVNEGESGRAKMNQWTYWLTVPLAFLQAFGTVQFINATTGQPIITNFGFDKDPLATFALLVSMTAGTLLLIWIGELISQQGIGNGISIIIFGGIVSGIPRNVYRSVVSATAGGGGIPWGLIAFVVIGALTTYAIVFVYEGQRRIPVQYAKRLRGNRWYGGGTTHIPLRVNSAGMIPLIFASSIMIFPGTVSSYFMHTGNDFVDTLASTVYNLFYLGSSWLYWVLYFMMVVGFTFFYALVLFEQQKIAETLQKHGGFVPGIRPGRPTQEYLYKVLTRITWGGAIFLGAVAVLPFIARNITQIQALTLSSTALLIVVGVLLDTIKQLEAQLLMRHYQGFIR
ncbi:MAG TPA: preprotein translocase subunit SecY [Chloroflexota bacterium]|nr:preprotein translocase subunit SecY [Chloroflexota bacterium]